MDSRCEVRHRSQEGKRSQKKKKKKDKKVGNKVGLNYLALPCGRPHSDHLYMVGCRSKFYPVTPDYEVLSYPEFPNPENLTTACQSLFTTTYCTMVTQVRTDEKYDPVEGTTVVLEKDHFSADSKTGQGSDTQGDYNPVGRAELRESPVSKMILLNLRAGTAQHFQ